MGDVTELRPVSQPGQYKRKPVTIEAIQITDSNIAQVAQWIYDSPGDWLGDWGPRDASEWRQLEGGAWEGIMPWLMIKTLEGTFKAELGWWVVKGVVGEFYAVRADVFEQLYDPA